MTTTVESDVERIKRIVAQADKVLKDHRAHDAVAPRIAMAAQRLNGGLAMLAEAEKKHLDIRLEFAMPAVDLTPPHDVWDDRGSPYSVSLERVGSSFHAAVRKAVAGGLIGRDRKLGELHRG